MDWLRPFSRRCTLTITVALVAGLLLVGQFDVADAQEPSDVFTIAVIPDTQNYVQTEAGTAVFAEQFRWIVEERDDRNIVFVSHVGDVSQNPDSVTEWDRIDNIFAKLDEANIAYGISPGNRDMNDDATAPEYDARFGASRYQGKAWFGGNHGAEGYRSSYQTISVDGHELLFVHLRHLQSDYGDVDAVLDWFGDVLDDHSDHLTFVTTHEFTGPDNGVYIPALQDAIAASCNVVGVFSGHRFGYGNGSFTDRCGRTVQHLLTNYQGLEGGGQGYLRLVEVDSNTLETNFDVYSPTLDQPGQSRGESFSASLSQLIPVLGDVTCDRVIDIGDALMIAQYSVGLRSEAASCRLGQAANNLDIGPADVDQNGSVDVGDALIVAQCSVGLTNSFCPG